MGKKQHGSATCYKTVVGGKKQRGSATCHKTMAGGKKQRGSVTCYKTVVRVRNSVEVSRAIKQ